jgi:PAS domain S-box-containing protein
MPLVKAGRLVALMAIHDKLPHQWTDYEQVVIREVTERSWAHVERVRSDAELRSSNARFRAAIRATKGVLWTNDPQGRMIGEQPGWGALTGQSYEEYQDFGWADVVHPDDAEPTVSAWNAAVAAKSTFIFEHRLRLADASWGLFSIRAVPSLDDDGEVTEWVGVHTDITEERARDDALHESNETLEVLNKTGGAIAAELDLEQLVQMVTDAGVELTGAKFGAFFYNVVDKTLTSLGCRAPQRSFTRPSWAKASSGPVISRPTSVTARTILIMVCQKGTCQCEAIWQCP